MAIRMRMLLTVLPLFIVGAVISLLIVRDLNKNSQGLLQTLSFESQAARVSPLIMSQLDATKTILLDLGRLGDVAEKRIEDYEMSIELLDKLESESINPEVKRLVSRIKKYSADVIENENMIIMEKVFDSQEEAITYYFDEYLPKEKVFQGFLIDLRSVIKKDVVLETQKMEENNSRTILVVLSLLFSMIFICSCYLFWISSVISRNLSNNASLLEKGIEDLEKVSNQLNQETKRSLEDTKSNLVEVNHSKDSLLECKENLKEIQQNSQLSQNISGEMTTNISEGNLATKTLHESMVTLQSNEKHLDNLVSIFHLIDEHTKGLDHLVFNTKILSFNASIEAELAGEHGRGFSIVAQEVGKLARESGEIATLIQEKVRGNIENVSSTVESLHHQIIEVKKAGDKSQEVFHEIGGTIHKNISISNEIHQSAEKQNSQLLSVEETLKTLHGSGEVFVKQAEGQMVVANVIQENTKNIKDIETSLKKIIYG
ncbi:MAG: methyl-accepting chemotaxis protein [Oligoflexales bacterium]